MITGCRAESPNPTGLKRVRIEPHHHDSCPMCGWRTHRSLKPAAVVSLAASSVRYAFECPDCEHEWLCAFSRRVS